MVGYPQSERNFCHVGKPCFNRDNSEILSHVYAKRKTFICTTWTSFSSSARYCLLLLHKNEWFHASCIHENCSGQFLTPYFLLREILNLNLTFAVNVTLNLSYISLRKQPTLSDATAGFLAKWRLRNKRRNSILMTRHYPDLASPSDWLKKISHAARPIRSTTQIWVVTRQQYGISALVFQTSFRGETSGYVAKCRLFSQAKTIQYIPRGFWTILLFLDCP